MISVRSKMSPGALSTKLRQLQRRFNRVSPVLLIDAVRPTVHGEVLLTSLDFPDYFVDMAHPEDYVVSERRMDPYLIENTVPHHHRLLLRVSLEARPGTFAVMTFVLDTGASSAVYFGRRAMQLMHEVGRLREVDLGVVYLDTPLGRCAVLETPATHQPANILGLDMLKKLKLGVAAVSRHQRTVSVSVNRMLNGIEPPVWRSAEACHEQ